MTGPALGVLGGDQVRVQEPAEANRLYNKGFVGTPEPGNSLRLTLVEAAYAVETGRLAIEGMDLQGLLAHGAADGERTEVHYLAYRDLRERGLVVRPEGDAYQVWRRGDGPKEDPWFRCHPRSERDPLRAADVAGLAGGVLSVVDEDGALTHYDVHDEHPVGEVRPGDLPAATGTLLDDRVLVTDPEAVAAYHAREHLGTPTGDHLVLSLTEAESLRRRGVLEVPAALAEHAAARQHHFPRTLPVYESLRGAGVVARSGFRFGTHLRGYARSPDEGHADWLIHAAFPDDVLHASDLSRAVRVAHAVRKTFCLALADPEPVRFVAIDWFRP